MKTINIKACNIKASNNKASLQQNRLALAIGTSLLLSTGALAEEAAQETKDLKLEVIEVTATKRVASIQDVPMSITAVSGSAIEEAGIKDLSEMSAYIPNLTISEGAINTNIYMRGVGSGINRAFEQSVGMFIDGIYMGRGKQFRAPFMDVERAEVLRGPQGLLFGKNTIAGTINISTAKAEAGGDFEGRVTADYESEYGGKGLTAVLASGLTDTFGIRLAVKSSESDGYMENTFTERDEVATEEDIVRLSAHWQPMDELDAHFKVEHGEFSSRGTNAQFIGLAPLDGLAGFVGGLLAPTLDPEFNDKRDLKTSTDEVLNPEKRSVEADNFSLNIDYALDNGTLTFVTGYSAYESELLQDVDFMPVTFINTNDVEDFSQTSVELRYASSGDNTFDYITGVYYQENELDFDFYSHLDITQISPVLTQMFNDVPLALLTQNPDHLAIPVTAIGVLPESFTRTTNFLQETETLSAFFQGTYNVSDDFRLIFGGRYTEETKDVVRSSLNATLESSFLADATSVGPGNIPGSPEFNAWFTAFALNVSVTDPTGGGSIDESKFIPSIKFQYDVNDDIMIYGGAEEGFKGGGFNANADATDDNNEFGGEEALGLELGMKSDLLDGRARLNIALFRTEFDNLQVTSWNGFGFEVGNAAESISQGIEIDGSILLTESFTLSGSLSYLDSYYESYSAGPCTAVKQAQGMETCDLTGKSTAFAPEYSASLFLDYYTEVGESMEFKAQLNVNYKDDFFYDTDLDPNLMQEAHTKVNMRIAIADIDEAWEIALIGKNLTDELTFSAGLDVPLVKGGYMGFTDAPRMISVQGTYRF